MNNSLQVLVAEFNQLHKNQVERHSRVLDLASEVGEVCKLAFSENVNGPVETSKWEDELADVLYALISLMNDMKIDADRAMRTVLEKYESRLSRTGRMQSGD
jgi:NTP pyrophosphatase (non-canonical NTP hydrolase)